MAQSYTSYMTADHNMRSSKLIGMTVYNEQNEKIGVIDDIMLPVFGGEVTAVVSVGGFLGVGEKLIKVPLSHVHFMADKPMMPGQQKADADAMPKILRYQWRLMPTVSGTGMNRTVPDDRRVSVRFLRAVHAASPCGSGWNSAYFDRKNKIAATPR